MSQVAGDLQTPTCQATSQYSCDRRSYDSVCTVSIGSETEQGESSWARVSPLDVWPVWPQYIPHRPGSDTLVRRFWGWAWTETVVCVSEAALRRRFWFLP